MAGFEKITIEVVVKASPERAWEAFTKPESMVQWNFASPDWHCPRASNDLRVGGALSSRMEAKDGSVGFDFGGTYTELTTGKHLAYVLGDGRKVSVDFTPQGGSTKVTETFDAETENPLEMQRGGWQAILDNYRRHAEA